MAPIKTASEHTGNVTAAGLSIESSGSYFQTRMDLLGITEADNTIQILQNENGQNVLKPLPVFRQNIKHGEEYGIDILVYTLERTIIHHKPDGSRWSKDYCLTRLVKPITKKDGSTMKYQIPKGAGTYPFFPPMLVEKFENKTPIDTLILTEGYFKAWKACAAGIPTVGLSSITHMQQTGKKQLHIDIEKLVKFCSVKRVVWLTDGDCIDITSKELTDGVDLYKRPNNFFFSCETFKRLFDDYEVDKYFFHIDTDQILNNHRTQLGNDRSKVKGLDDLLCAFPDRTEEIAKDILSISKQSNWFVKHNITSGSRNILNYFNLRSPREFYLFHVERRPEIKEIEWVFNGTRYKWDEEKGDVKIVSPKDAKDYFRVGDQYYEFVHVPNKYGQIEKRWQARMKGTIMDDHGRTIFQHIPKYKAFCSVPDHLNFQSVINNCFNIYSPFEWEADAHRCSEADFPNILQFIKHIFGEAKITFTNPDTKTKHEYINWELGMDYLQLLLQRPTEKLPIICLVSRLNNTGKSTFGKFLKILFTGNVAIVGNQDLAGDFNAHWASKLLVICDETKIDKQHVVEKVKNLSTADKIMMNAKGKDHVELDCFIKFIFITNNEDSFMTITEDDIRYWVHKVPRINSEVTNMLYLMQEEIPSFLSFLSTRKLLTEQLNRMWFHPLLLKTEALKKVIVNSQPTILKELMQHLRDMFMDFGVDKIHMTSLDIKEEFFRGARYEKNYIEKIVREELKATNKTFEYNGNTYSTEAEAIAVVRKEQGIDNDFEAQHHVKINQRVGRYSYPKWLPDPQNANNLIRHDVKRNGRPYCFHRKDFIADNERIELDPELQHINDMTPAKQAFQQSLHMSLNKQEPAEDLPF
jgi:hypothetical protein